MWIDHPLLSILSTTGMNFVHDARHGDCVQIDLFCGCSKKVQKKGKKIPEGLEEEVIGEINNLATATAASIGRMTGSRTRLDYNIQCCCSFLVIWLSGLNALHKSKNTKKVRLAICPWSPTNPCSRDITTILSVTKDLLKRNVLVVLEQLISASL
jgi:hypothetical protein